MSMRKLVREAWHRSRKKDKIDKKAKTCKSEDSGSTNETLSIRGDEGGGDGQSSVATELLKSYVCEDGQTEIPYEVMGTQELEGNNINFVVLHDFLIQWKVFKSFSSGW